MKNDLELGTHPEEEESPESLSDCLISLIKLIWDCFIPLAQCIGITILLLLCFLIYLLIMVLYFVLVVIPNFIVLIVYTFASWMFSTRKWLGWNHEATCFSMIARLDYQGADYYRTNTKQITCLVNELIEIGSSSSKNILSKAKQTMAIRNIFGEMITNQITRVNELIMGGTSYIKVAETTTLSSVVVSTLFFGAYLIYMLYISHDTFEISEVKSKVHDALAIILPLLLVEELAAGMSAVFLYLRWLTYRFESISDVLYDVHSFGDNDDNYAEVEPSTLTATAAAAAELNAAYGAMENPSTPEQIKKNQRKLSKLKRKFAIQVSKECASVGIGAIDMTGIASFAASLWTLVFLGQGFIVENIESFERPIKEVATKVYVWSVILSGSLILFCYIPFFIRRSEEQIERFNSVSASCEAHMFMESMSKLQNQLMDTLHPVLERHTHELIDIQSENTPLKPTTDAPRNELYKLLRRLRHQALRKMETERIISFVLHLIGLSTYDFFKGTVNDIPISELKEMNKEDNEQNEDICIRELEQLNFDKPFWSAVIDADLQSIGLEAGKTNDLLPTILLQLPLPFGKQIKNDATMTLFSVPVMGVSSFHDVLRDRNITDMATIYDNPLVQEKKVYVSSSNVMCIGLEIKIMANYIVSIYLVAHDGKHFGNGSVYVALSELDYIIRLDGTEFNEVEEEKEIFAFGSCILDIQQDDNLAVNSKYRS